MSERIVSPVPRTVVPNSVAGAAVDGPVVVADEACVHYGAVVALAPTSLAIRRGESVSLVGQNGSGKSTLLSMLAGLLRPTSGTVVRLPGTRVAFVAQHQHQHRWMPLSVTDVLRMGRYGERGLLGRLRADDRRAIDAGVTRMEIGSLLRRSFGELSGGQRQRVLVAQALAAEPLLLLLDEPITGLDLVSQQLILDVVADETARGTAVVLSTHHLGEARRTDRVLLLAGCVMADGAPAEVLRPELLAEAFGNRLVPAPGPAGGVGGVVVIDEHGHDDDDHSASAVDLIPQHHHDHDHSHAQPHGNAAP